MQLLSLALSLALCQDATLPDHSFNHVTEQANKIFACPRCRRAEPKGPRKLPHPGFKKKEDAPQPPLVTQLKK